MELEFYIKRRPGIFNPSRNYWWICVKRFNKHYRITSYDNYTPAKDMLKSMISEPDKTWISHYTRPENLI